MLFRIWHIPVRMALQTELSSRDRRTRSALVLLWLWGRRGERQISSRFDATAEATRSGAHLRLPDLKSDHGSEKNIYEHAKEAVDGGECRVRSHRSKSRCNALVGIDEDLPRPDENLGKGEQSRKRHWSDDKYGRKRRIRLTIVAIPSKQQMRTPPPTTH